MKKDDLRRAAALLEKGDWRAAHEIVQRDEDSALACWAHGIVLMEGDTGNARYWYRRRSGRSRRRWPRRSRRSVKR